MIEQNLSPSIGAEQNVLTVDLSVKLVRCASQAKNCMELGAPATMEWE